MSKECVQLCFVNLHVEFENFEKKIPTCQLERETEMNLPYKQTCICMTRISLHMSEEHSRHYYY